MTVEGAIKELRRQRSMMGVPASSEAILMAISALEKEKEPALQEAKTSSNKNYSNKNDNTKLKECQEDINVIKKLFDNVWCTLTSSHKLVCVIDLFKEENK